MFKVLVWTHCCEQKACRPVCVSITSQIKTKTQKVQNVSQLQKFSSKPVYEEEWDICLCDKLDVPITFYILHELNYRGTVQCPGNNSFKYLWFLVDKIYSGYSLTELQ